MPGGEGLQKAIFSLAPAMAIGLVKLLNSDCLSCGWMCCIGVGLPLPLAEAIAAACLFAKTGVSGVGGRPVQLASEEIELEEELDSMLCLRWRFAAAAAVVNACLGVRGACVDTKGGGGEFFDRVA